jgi:unspecific monooxygenase
MKPSSEIPRPAGSLLSHSLRFVKNTMQFYEDAFRECGDMFTTRIPGLGNWVYICSPELVRTVFAAPPDILAGGDLGGFSLAHLIGHGGTSELDGPAHQERRDVISPYLDAQGSLAHVEAVRRITERRLAEWPLGQPFPLVLALQKIALEALLQMMFSQAGPDRVRQLADIYEDFSFKGLRSPAASHSSLQIDFPGSPWRGVKKRQQIIFKTFSDEIEARLAAIDDPAADDLVLGLARARLADGSRLSRETMIAELLELLFQGHEMTGNAMTWILGELLTHPETLARLRQELATGEGGLPYLEAVISEGLRRRPVNFVTGVRRAKQPFELGGYLLPEGTFIAVCYPAVAMREDLFPHPKDFDPTRFEGQPPPTDARCPFGTGAHACPGKDFALMVLKTAIATIVRKADLKLAQDEIRPVRKAYYYEPNKGMLVVLEKRS